MPTDYSGSFERVRAIAEAAVGIVLCTLPLALWVAWSTRVFNIVLLVGAIGTIAFVCLVRLRVDRQDAGIDLGERILLDEQDIAQHQRLYPMIHQNTAQSRKAMMAIKSSLETTSDGRHEQDGKP